MSDTRIAALKRERRRLLFVALVLPAVARAVTTVSGAWTAAQSPYRVADTLLVPAGVTLTIEPGVNVLFDEDVPFLVEGRLVAVGTQSDSIRFLPGESSEWHGIRITGSDSSTLAFVRISGDSSSGPGALRVEGARVGVRRSRFVHNTDNGVSIHRGARATFDSCESSDNAGRGFV